MKNGMEKLVSFFLRLMEMATSFEAINFSKNIEMIKECLYNEFTILKNKLSCGRKKACVCSIYKF